MRTAVIQNNSLLDSGRIDPSYHLSESIKLKKQLLGSPYKLSTIGEESEDVYLGNIFTRVFVKDAEHGVPYIAASDMTKASVDSGKFISKKQAKKLKRLMLDSGWILISCSGTLGNVVYTNDLFKNTFATHDLIRLIPNDKKMPSGFLYAYLASKYGYTLLTQSGFGGVVKHINSEHVANIPIPLFPEPKQQEIHNLIIESANLRVEANRLLEEAVAYFNSKIEVSQKTQKFFSKPVKELSFSWASYNNNKQCDSIENRIGYDSVKMEDISEKIFAPPMFKHIYLNKDNGNPFLTGAELTRQNPKFYRWLSPKGVKDIDDYKVKKGTLLLYKSGTTDGGILGNVFIADDNLDGVCLSDHVIRITMNKLSDAYWAYAFLKSNAGVQLLLRLATGTMIPFITPERLKGLSIPKQDEQYEKITDLIDRYIFKRVLANNKENQAISLVEKEIESWQQS